MNRTHPDHCSFSVLIKIKKTFLLPEQAVNWKADSLLNILNKIWQFLSGNNEGNLAQAL